MARWLVVGVGGFLGSVTRYWLAGVVQRSTESSFPLGTLAVNVLGSLILGIVMALSLERELIDPEVRLFLAVGFCGGFTTMSTLSYETLALLRDGGLGAALLNALVSLFVCVFAVWVGYLIARFV